MIQDVKSSPFILSAIPRIICNKCTLWTEEDALKNSFLCILSKYSLTKKENTSCFEPTPMRQLYIFGISIIEWVNQVIDDKNKWILIQGKNACSIFSDVMRVWDLIFSFLKVIKISFILKREKKNKKRSQRTDRTFLTVGSIMLWIYTDEASFSLQWSTVSTRFQLAKSIILYE